MAIDESRQMSVGRCVNAFLMIVTLNDVSSIQANRSLRFLEDRSPQRPFFLLLCPPAPHSPWTPAPKYQKQFADVKAPRGGSFDKPGKVRPR